MSVFSWLRIWFTKPNVESDDLKFVRAVSAEHAPSISAAWYLGYLYEIALLYPVDGIVVKIEYNTIRRKWEIEIFSNGKELYYRDVYDRQPYDAINFLIEKYGLQTRVDLAISNRKMLDKQREDELDKIKNKYVK